MEKTLTKPSDVNPPVRQREALLLFLGNHLGFGRRSVVRLFLGVLGSLVEVDYVSYTVLELIHAASLGVVPERGATALQRAPLELL